MEIKMKLQYHLYWCHSKWNTIAKFNKTYIRSVQDKLPENSTQVITDRRTTDKMSVLLSLICIFHIIPIKILVSSSGFWQTDATVNPERSNPQRGQHNGKNGWEEWKQKIATTWLHDLTQNYRDQDGVVLAKEQRSMQPNTESRNILYSTVNWSLTHEQRHTGYSLIQQRSFIPTDPSSVESTVWSAMRLPSLTYLTF